MAETIGDVKYSILEPGAFTRLNPGWELLTAKALAPNSPLGLLGVPQLPDGRGVFIRAMNEDRDKKTGDADGNRAVGTPQSDLFAQHSHEVGYPYGANQFAGLYTNSNGTYQVDPHQNKTNCSASGGNETRPRNICLYLYIKTS